jgi:Protein of unknown function (DUF3618)
MGQDPDQVREEIEATRARMGEHVDAIAYKADVPARAKDKVSDVKHRIAAKITGTTPDSDEVKGAVVKSKGLAQDFPLGLAIGAAAVGFLAGLVIPATRFENERIGPVADKVKDRARDLGTEALEHGKEVASDVADAAKDAAKDSGSTHADELKREAGEQAKAARSDVSN